jgi:Ca2+/Na+ antiporter
MMKEKLLRFRTTGIIVLFSALFVAPSAGWSGGLIFLLFIIGVCSYFVETKIDSYRSENRAFLVIFSVLFLLYFTSVNESILTTFLFFAFVFYPYAIWAARRGDRLIEQDNAKRRFAEQRRIEALAQQKKPVEKKPVEKKPVEKKPVEKKPVEKKPVEKKPVDTQNESIGKQGNTDSYSADIESAANDLIAAFFEGYLVSCAEVRGEDSEPDLSVQVSLVDGRELLLNANKNIASSSPSEVRKLVEKAAEHFELCYRSPVIDEQGYIAESRAQARMWLGISQSILSYDSQSFDNPQTKGPGFAFAESASIFLGLQNFRMLGRVLQEWAESLLYVRNEKDALGLFQIAMLTFNSFGEKERAVVVQNRLKDLSPSKIDSAFLARGPVPGQEQMTTVLGCRNTSELRRICEIGFNILDFLPNSR